MIFNHACFIALKFNLILLFKTSVCIHVLFSNKSKFCTLGSTTGRYGWRGGSSFRRSVQDACTCVHFKFEGAR